MSQSCISKESFHLKSEKNSINTKPAEIYKESDNTALKCKKNLVLFCPGFVLLKKKSH